MCKSMQDVNVLTAGGATVSLCLAHAFFMALGAALRAFNTLGGNTSPNARKVLNVLGIIVAVALFVGFMSWRGVVARRDALI